MARTIGLQFKEEPKKQEHKTPKKIKKEEKKK